ncbi:MAG: hypothetical protein D3914_07050, partial [Candidatus Electrothrix sp. LOE2]|nr:hypothetical protein [Candidatus Electrothrix sp. LOE2]
MKLHSVGIKYFTCPVSIREQKGGVQQTVAEITLQASLPHRFKQSCLETFTCILSKYQQDMHTKIFPKLLTEVQSNLQAKQAGSNPWIVVPCFPLFLLPDSLRSFTIHREAKIE